MAEQWSDLNDFLATRATDLKPTSLYPFGPVGEYDSYNVLADYTANTGQNAASTNDAGYKEWVASRVLNGMTPEQYIASENERIGLGPNNLTGNHQGGFAWNPETQQVMTRSFDSQAGAFMDWIKIPATFAAMAFGANAITGALSGAAGGMSVSELASADIALGGAGGSAGAAGLSAGAAGGGFISDLIQRGVDFLQGGEGGSFDLGEVFNSFSEGVKNFFSPAADSPWGVNAISEATTGMAGDAAGSLIESQMGMSGAESIATQAAQAGGIATSAAETVSGVARRGLIERGIDWATKNKELTAGALQLGGGILKGIGENAAMDRRIAAEREIAAGRSPEALLATQRANAASSGAYGQTLRFGAPATPRVLRRPDGTLVYAQPGIVAGQVRA